MEDEAAASGDDVASTHSSNSLSASAKEFIPSKSSPVEEDVYEGRNCARCNKLFYVFRDTGECVNLEECLYHWGKARSSRKYSCCGRRSKSGMCVMFYQFRILFLGCPAFLSGHIILLACHFCPAINVNKKRHD